MAKSYTDAYYAKEGYRTKQYRAKLSLKKYYALPIDDYNFNDFPNRRNRRSIAKSKGVFGFGIWKETLSKLKNVQTFIKEKDDKQRINP